MERGSRLGHALLTGIFGSAQRAHELRVGLEVDYLQLQNVLDGLLQTGILSAAAGEGDSVRRTGLLAHDEAALGHGHLDASRDLVHSGYGNGYSVFEQSLLRYIAAGLGVSYEQLSRNYAQMSYSTARASANESWAYFMGRRKFVASRQASQMFLCWLEEAIVRRVVTLPSKARFSFQEARSAWGNCDWIGSGRMAIDGLKEVQEAVMLIEAGLSTYEKECAKRGDDYQEIFAQQVRETMERRAAGLKPPAWAAAAFESGLRQSTEEEKSDSRAA